MDLLKRKVLNHQVRSALASKGYMVGDVGGDKIFTDEKIKNSFIDSISQQDTFKPMMNKIIELVETDRIIPVYVKFGVLEKISNFFFSHKRKFAESKNVLAFCDFNTQKIIVLVENITNHEYWNKQEALSLVVLHELQHLCSYMMPDKFMNLNKKSYVRYFKRFFDSYFGADVSDEDAFSMAVFLNKNFELMEDKKMTYKILFNMYYELLDGILLRSKILNYRPKITEFLQVIILYITNPTLYHEHIAYRESRTIEVFNSLRVAYKGLNILNTGSLYIQEIIYCSEIICIESEYNTQPKHLTLINSIG